MEETDERFIRGLTLFLLVLGVALALVWDADDEVRSAPPVLGRTHNEIQADPTGNDKKLAVHRTAKETEEKRDKNK